MISKEKKNFVFTIKDSNGEAFEYTDSEFFQKYLQ